VFYSLFHEGCLSGNKKMLAIKKELDYLNGRYKGEHRVDDRMKSMESENLWSSALRNERGFLVYLWK